MVNNKDNNEYVNIKKEIEDLVVEEIKKLWMIKNVKFINTLTPVSFEKWLSSSAGAIYDLANIPGQAVINRLQHTVNIRNLYIVGAKTFPGSGIIGALISAFTLCDILLKNRLTHKKLLINS